MSRAFLLSICVCPPILSLCSVSKKVVQCCPSAYNLRTIYLANISPEHGTSEEIHANTNERNISPPWRRELKNCKDINGNDVYIRKATVKMLGVILPLAKIQAFRRRANYLAKATQWKGQEKEEEGRNKTKKCKQILFWWIFTYKFIIF